MVQSERMISAGKLVTVLAKRFRSKGMIHYDDLMAAIADIPAVDAVEVVHGRWSIVGDACVCSVCHNASIATYYFCPECGAKMDGGNGDGLVAHGVTVQEWISVKDRLPEIVSTHKRYRSTIKKSVRVLCVCVQKSGKTMVKEGYCEWYNDYPEPRWQIPGTIDDVTHWQHLPQPPKGD